MAKIRVMIMTASIGYGHDQVAESIQKHLIKIQENIEVKIVDFMSILPPSVSHLVKNTYLKLINVFPYCYYFLYKFTAKFNQKNKVKNLINYRYEKKIMDLLNCHNPDMILFTNPFPLIMVSYLKKTKKINYKTATIITDYTAHSVWIDEMIDCYFVGSDSVKNELISRGVSKSKIYVTGIPVHDQFNFTVDKQKVANKLDIDMKLPTVLIMGGGLGLGPIDKILDTLSSLNQPLQLLVVSGANEQLRRNLELRRYNPQHKVKIFGFCKNVYELMECSHLLISKSGGITMTESVIKRLPVIIFDPIPGQELMNAQYFCDMGTAVLAKNLLDVKRWVVKLFYEKPEERMQMIKSCDILRKPKATEKVTKLIMLQIKNNNRGFKKCKKG